jgi:hypothetical protein
MQEVGQVIKPGVHYETGRTFDDHQADFVARDPASLGRLIGCQFRRQCEGEWR